MKKKKKKRPSKEKQLDREQRENDAIHWPTTKTCPEKIIWGQLGAFFWRNHNRWEKVGYPAFIASNWQGMCDRQSTQRGKWELAMKRKRKKKGGERVEGWGVFGSFRPSSANGETLARSNIYLHWYSAKGWLFNLYRFTPVPLVGVKGDRWDRLDLV